MTQTGPTRDKGEQFSRGPVRQPPIEPGRAEQARRIAMLAPPWMPIPPPRCGGIETVIAMLTDKLVDLRKLPENYRPRRRGTGSWLPAAAFLLNLAADIRKASNRAALGSPIRTRQ